MRSLRALPSLAICFALLAAAPDPEPTVDALLGAERVRIPLASLAERVPLAADQDFRVLELGRDAGTSHHLVAIRSAETPHRHDRHDLFVIVVRGHGTMRIGDAAQPVGQGSILYVPRRAVHAFANWSGAPAVAYAVYSPPFDGKDRVEVASLNAVTLSDLARRAAPARGQQHEPQTRERQRPRLRDGPEPVLGRGELDRSRRLPDARS